MTQTPARPGMPVDPIAALSEIRSLFHLLTPQARIAGWLDKSVARIPAVVLLGVTPLVADAEDSRVDLEIGPDMLGPDGCLPAGLLAYFTDILAGTAIGCVADRKPMVTVTISVEPVVDDLPTAGFLAGRSRVVSSRGDRVLAEGEIREASGPGQDGGRLLARVASWFLVLHDRPPFETVVSLPSEPQPPATDVGLGPIGALLGVRSLEHGPGTARAVLPMRPELMNLSLMLHGGIGALFADLVCAAALGGGTYRPLTSTYSYLRSAGANGNDVEVRARVLKPGRAVATVEAEVLSDDGKPALHVVTNASRVLTDPPS